MTRPTDRPRASVPPVDPYQFAPTPEHPVRAKHRRLNAETRIDPHQHPWAQLAFSITGVIRLTADHGTYIVPPSRAVWIPPGVEHAVSVLEDAELRTIYIHQDEDHCGPDNGRAAPDSPWRTCRVLEVSSLMRELVMQLTVAPGELAPSDREYHLSALVLDELRRAKPVPLGVALPRDKRLLSLCEAVIEDPGRWATLDDCARGTGASPRTVARLFRSELGTTFSASSGRGMPEDIHAGGARRLPMPHVWAELAYGSPGASTAMVRRSVGAPPSRFFS